MQSHIYQGIKITRNSHRVFEDELVVEAPLQININNEPYTVVMRTPDDDIELVRGLLFAEDIYKSVVNFNFSIIESQNSIPTIVNVTIPDNNLGKGYLNKRTLLSGSSCGICGKKELKDIEISGEKFESQKWKTANMNSEENWSLRWDMMNDLRNDYQLIGMSKNEIIKLLGEPDNKSEISSQFRYYLGYAHFGIDTGTLIIEFEKDSVKNYLGAPNNMAIDFSRSYTPLNDSIPEPVNVVVVMMESLGAQPLGLFNNPLKGSPFIDSLATKSWFLPNFYVPRYGTARTVFTSITGLPDVVEDKTASRNPKAINQRVILDQLKGMEKLYFLGGSASWANIRALFTNNVSDIKIYEEGSYDQEDRVDVWGINDGDLFRNANKTLTELHQKNKPFIAYIQTSGYHPPYTVPDQEGDYKRLTTKDISEQEVQKAGFVSLDQYNALRYFDHNLRILFELSKKSGYYKNTVFLLFGDHNGRISPYKHMTRPDFETGLGQLHVPFIIHGDMLPKWQDHRMASLMDLYPTIADLLNQPYTNYTLGRSLLRRPKNDNSPTFVFDFFNGSLKPTAILPEHYYFAEKSGKTVQPIYPNTKPGYDQADTSFGNQRVKQLDSLAKGMYQSTLYLYFNNKK